MKTVKYELGNKSYYREGRVYEPYSVVEIPADEKPGKDWTKLSAGETTAQEEPGASLTPPPTKTASSAEKKQEAAKKDAKKDDKDVL
jgi:hypothetical protein